MFAEVVGAVLVILPAVVDMNKGSPDFTTVANAADGTTNPFINIDVEDPDPAVATQIPNILTAADANVVASANCQVLLCVL